MKLLPENAGEILKSALVEYYSDYPRRPSFFIELVTKMIDFLPITLGQFLILFVLPSSYPSKLAHEALSVLAAFSDYAKEPATQAVLLNALSETIPAYRRIACVILHNIGHPLGLEHLVYCGLAVHPVFGYEQKYWDIQIHSRTSLIRVADELTDEQIGLLIEESCRPGGNLHIDALAALPAERIVGRIRPLLLGTEREQLHAAYVLAIKGNAAGRPLLKKMLREGQHIEFALVGLSHIADSETLELCRAYLDPKPSFFDGLNKDTARYVFEEIQQKLDYRLQLMEKPGDETLLALIEQHYISSGVSHWSLPDVPEGLLRLQAESKHFLKTATFLAEFASQALRQRLFDRQVRRAQALLRVDPSGRILEPVCQFYWYWCLPSDDHLRDLGLQLIVDPEDYLRAATQWILHPEKYRQEFVERSIAGYMREKMY